jgi:hypothetical protein
MSDIHKVWTDNRITVIGPKQQVVLFRKSNWEDCLGARYGEFIEKSKGRFICEFKTITPPIELLRKLSAEWSRLVLLLDYEAQHQGLKGLAKAQAGQLQDYRISY